MQMRNEGLWKGVAILLLAAFGMAVLFGQTNVLLGG
jgi:hypothetical protein